MTIKINEAYFNYDNVASVVFRDLSSVPKNNRSLFLDDDSNYFMALTTTQGGKKYVYFDTKEQLEETQRRFELAVISDYKCIDLLENDGK